MTMYDQIKKTIYVIVGCVLFVMFIVFGIPVLYVVIIGETEESFFINNRALKLIVTDKANANNQEISISVLNKAYIGHFPYYTDRGAVISHAHWQHSIAVFDIGESRFDIVSVYLPDGMPEDEHSEIIGKGKAIVFYSRGGHHAVTHCLGYAKTGRIYIMKKSKNKYYVYLTSNGILKNVLGDECAPDQYTYEWEGFVEPRRESDAWYSRFYQ